MARGGARKGSSGKSYSNRSDLNVDRAVQPGSSAAPPAVAPQAAQQQRPMIRPDDIPSLDTPTLRPDSPITTGLPTGPGPGPGPESAVAMKPLYDPLRAALRRDPTNQALRRMAAYLEARGGA